MASLGLPDMFFNVCRFTLPKDGRQRCRTGDQAGWRHDPKGDMTCDCFMPPHPWASS